MKSLTKLISIVTLATGLAITINQPTANAKTHPATRISTLTYTTPWQGVAKKGYLYSSARLTKKVHHMTNFKHTVLKVMQKVKVKQNGHYAYYYHVKSTNGKLKGYAWHGNVYHYIQPIKSVTNKPVSTAPKDSNTNSDNQSNDDSNTNSQPAQLKAFNLDEYRQDFLNDLNQERAKRGLNPLTINNTLNTIAETRAKTILDNGSLENTGHYDSTGQLVAIDLLKQSVDTSVAITAGETLGQKPWNVDPNDKWNSGANSESKIAKDQLYSYIYDDAASNWGHRDILLKKDANTVGIGAICEATPDSSDPNYYYVYNAVEVGKLI